MDSTPVTQETIAEKLGLSLATVCYALNGTGTIAAKTRLRVIEMATKLGYTPNHQASALARRRKSNHAPTDLELVAILHSDSGDSLSKPFNTPEAAQHAVEIGLKCIYFNLQEYTNIAALGRMLRARGFTGIILDRIMETIDLSEMPWDSFSVIAAGRFIQELPFDCVRSSPASNIRYALDEVKRRGYKRPGVCLIKHPMPVIDDLDRLGEVLANNQTSPLPDAVPPFFEYFYHGVDLMQYNLKIRQWFEHYRPDVVIGFNSSYQHILTRHEWKIPGDAGYLSLHIRPEDPWDDDISGYVQVHSTAKVALDRVSFLISRNRLGIPDEKVDLIVKPMWREGVTLPYITGHC